MDELIEGKNLCKSSYRFTQPSKTLNSIKSETCRLSRRQNKLNNCITTNLPIDMF